MNTVPNESTCPKCGQPVSLNAFEGLCPACLLQAGFGTVIGAEKLSAFIPPTPAELAKHFPQLEIIELLGRGGMGAVYKARQIHLDRIVALKILPPAVSQAPAFAERFVREARALAKLHHPNIVTLYESGQADDLFFFLMEFVDGVNLRQLLSTGTISAKDALAIVPQICDALQFAHDRGIVHRDIKPENILLSKSGQVKIADFGIAKIVAGEMAEVPSSTDTSSESSQTEIGKILGTPQYMAPEQISHPLDVDNRADIYALGVVFYQMLTGELPAGKFEPPSHKVQIDVRLDEIVLRALAHQPDLRYQQASVMKTHVETISSSPPIPAAPGLSHSSLPPLPKGEISSSSRFSRTAIFGAVLLTFSLMGGVLLLLLANAYRPDNRGLALVSTLILFLSLGSFFGTTILGWIAVYRIRHSAGKLYGIGIALFDALFFPLLLLDGLLGRLVNHAVNFVGDSFGQSLLNTATAVSPTITHTEPTLLCRLFFDHRPELTQFVWLLLVVIVDFFLIRWVWRVVNQPPSNLSPAPEHPPVRRTTVPVTNLPPSSKGAFPFLVPVLRWFLVAFAVFAFTVLGGALITFQFLPKVYTATSLIQVHAAIPVNPSDPDTVSTALQGQFAVIQSPDVLLPVIQHLNLDTLWAKRNHPSSTDTLPPVDAVAAMQKSLRLDVRRGTNIIEVSASSPVPSEAAEIANAVVDRYKTLRVAQENQRNQRGEATLQEQIAQQQKVVDEKRSAAASLLAGLQQKNIPIPADTAASAAANLDARKKDLLAAQEDYDARRVLLASVIDLPDDQFISTLKGLGREQKDLDPLGTRIAELETDIPNLERDGFLATNPRILALQEELTAKQKQRAEMISGLRRAMKVDTEMAKSRVTLLQNEVTGTKPPTVISPALAPYLTARRELIEQESLLDALTVRLKQVTTDRRLLESPVIILSRAEPPAYPSKPNTRLNLLLSALAGIVLGIVLASALEFIFWSRRSSTAKPAPVPPTPSSSTRRDSQNGKRLALAGTILQPLSILLMLASGIWQIHVFSTLSAHGPANLDTFGAALSQGVIASTTATVLFFVSLIFLSIALAVSRYRERWFFTFLTIYSWPLLLIFPFGTIAALFFLIYCLTHRHEFSTPSNLPASSAVSRKFPWGTISLILCLGALPAMFLVGALLHGSWRLVGVGTLLLEIAALVLGLIGWRSNPGKIAAILSGLLLLAFIPAGIFIATLMQAAANKPGFIQSDVPASPFAVAFTKMWTTHQWQDEIARQLQSRSERFDHVSLNFNTGTNTAIFTFSNLQEMKGVNGQNVWTPIDGTLTERQSGDSSWQVQGTGQLGAVQFTVNAPAADAHPTPSTGAQKYDALFTPPLVGTFGQLGQVMEIHATSSRPLAPDVVAVHYFSQIVGKDAGFTRGDEIALYGLPATLGEGGSWKGLVYPAGHKTFGKDRFTTYATSKEQAIALLESEPEKDRHSD